MKLSEKIQERRNDLDVAKDRLDNYQRIIDQVEEHIRSSRWDVSDIDIKLNWLKAYDNKFISTDIPKTTDAEALEELDLEFEEIDDKIKSIVNTWSALLGVIGSAPKGYEGIVHSDKRYQE